MSTSAPGDNAPSRSRSARPDRLLKWGAFGLIAWIGLILLPPLFQTARSGVGMPKSARPLREIGIAFQTYATRYEGLLPIAGHRGSLDPALSWQTQLLPYLDRSDLYNRIDFSRPWDDPANAEVFATQLPEFLIPGEPVPSWTDIQALTHQSANSRLIRPDRQWRIDDISLADGTATTIMCGEIGTALPPWGQPGNCRDPSNGIGVRPDQFGRSAHPFAYFLSVSGAVMGIDETTSPRVLELLADPENGSPSIDEF